LKEEKNTILVFLLSNGAQVLNIFIDWPSNIIL